MKRRLFVLGAMLVASLSAKDPVNPINVTRLGVAANGYDVVAYFTDNQPVKGMPQFTFDWMGSHWQFASAAHRDQFAASPARYAPQYGGYCAWAVGHGKTADTDPDAWRIIDGKLYLNYSKSIQQMWDQDRAKWITDADRNWPSLHQ